MLKKKKKGKYTLKDNKNTEEEELTSFSIYLHT